MLQYLLQPGKEVAVFFGLATRRGGEVGKDESCALVHGELLRGELITAMGCTEPIAIAYAAAKARSVLGALPDRVLVEVSGNIIKNVKSVVVPHTGGLRGIPAAAAAGIVAGDAEAQLEVLSGMTEAQSAAISPFLKVVPVEVRHADTPISSTFR